MACNEGAIKSLNSYQYHSGNVFTMFKAHAEFRSPSPTMESDILAASLQVLNEFWHPSPNHWHNSSGQARAGWLDEALRGSRTSYEQNERQTSWQDEEMMENEANSCKRCHGQNKKSRVRHPPRSRKPAQHHINSINLHQNLFLEASLCIFQHATNVGV